MKQQKTALVLGAGGFIGNHMVTRLKQENYWVRAVDLQLPQFSTSEADHFVLGDLRNLQFVKQVIAQAGNSRDPIAQSNTNSGPGFDEIYQFAADMGGAGFIFTGDNDADIMQNSVQINLNLLEAMKQLADTSCTRIFYSSSACVYPAHNQTSTLDPLTEESTAYPADPDSEYGWEKLFSERLYQAYSRNYGINIAIARYHNIYGPLGTWQGGREKAPAAICRKVATATDSIEIWGDGEQTRSFLYIDACIEATRRLMKSHFNGPVNIGSEEQVSINQLVDITCKIAGKQLNVVHVPGPQGVRGRNSHNQLFRNELDWDPRYSLQQGIEHTYKWIQSQLAQGKPI